MSSSNRTRRSKGPVGNAAKVVYSLTERGAALNAAAAALCRWGDQFRPAPMVAVTNPVRPDAGG